jgi:formylglycine-generating enzyme
MLLFAINLIFENHKYSMKMNKGRIFSLVLAAASLTFVSCASSGGKKKGGGTKNFTSRTGWKPNDSKGWFFSGKQQKNIKGWPGMVYIEGGAFTMGLTKDDVMRDWNNSPVRMQVKSFFIGETEVTNYEYREYLTWLKVVFPPEEELYKDIYNSALPDESIFNNSLSRDDFSTENYMFSQEFSYYPVVGITWLQAVNYCDWLTDRANEKALMDKGILAKDYYSNEEYNYGEKTFNTEQYKKNDSNVSEAIDSTKLLKSYQIKSTNTRIQNANRLTRSNDVQEFRLPTEAEWEYAALGLAGNREFNQNKGKEVNQNSFRTEKGKNRGQYLDNFKQGRGDYSGIGGFGNDGSAITNDVKKFASNDYGVYGMLGNVAEWTADIYRPIIDDEANDFNYFRGNNFKTTVDNGNGGFVKYDATNMEYDTLNNGRLVYKGLPGSYKKETVKDYRNFRDGDAGSSLILSNNEDVDTDDMYNSPVRRFVVDANGKVVLEKDGSQRTTELSDEVRVIKGGSWRDPIYWVDPGQRRYMHQAEATSWIGFRVAQDFKGTKESKRKRRGV